ncbi:hypothetical protein GYMLUDRAFT_44475 [Collybiopsis luxurians FD-317 M1]|uniref:Uncharacterized protein n=1 Tax=Collybiopsis luxurians FD-317 M1 TaxID=944289 RepID=A0A0D0CUL9_9AGAR|nr:hypothetical protein GYMLUDRAFT_44475 [Collybiopsis luxurians FD-317 M1]
MTPFVTPAMKLLRLTSSDILNTSLIDVSTSQKVYTLATTQIDSQNPLNQDRGHPASLGESVSESPHIDSPTFSYENAITVKSEPSDITVRRTSVLDSTGFLVAEIIWRGRRLDMTLGKHHIRNLSELFDTSNARMLSDTLAIPSKFDPKLIWVATEDSLCLVDSISSSIHGVLHQNSILPSIPFKSCIPISTSRPEPRHNNPKSGKIHRTCIPGLGHRFLELESNHTPEQEVELIVSFFMMEMIRRGRFTFTPYTFERSNFWSIIEVKELLMRKLGVKRNR